ncbi:hypothetical protein, partial [Salmonella enterica]|uniref:hypothetical protein n=1 Tax=Salmonella sp. SAL03628 TaxID=3159766 RepID=UPI001C616847|nr:hypothetical protein [Salmonella enterica subsp. enterica serovar Weltevreden]
DHAPAADGGGSWVLALFAAFVVAQVVRAMFRRAPVLVRGIAGGGAAGGIAWLISALLPVGLFAGLLGFFMALPGAAPGRYVRGGHW